MRRYDDKFHSDGQCATAVARQPDTGGCSRPIVEVSLARRNSLDLGGAGAPMVTEYAPWCIAADNTIGAAEPSAGKIAARHSSYRCTWRWTPFERTRIWQPGWSLQPDADPSAICCPSATRKRPADSGQRRSSRWLARERSRDNGAQSA